MIDLSLYHPASVEHAPHPDDDYSVFRIADKAGNTVRIYSSDPSGLVEAMLTALLLRRKVTLAEGGT